MTAPRFPEVEVDLVGHDGNAFSIMARVTKAMRRAGCSADEIAEYSTDAMSGDYANLLRVTASYVSVA